MIKKTRSIVKKTEVPIFFYKVNQGSRSNELLSAALSLLAKILPSAAMASDGQGLRLTNQ